MTRRPGPSNSNGALASMAAAAAAGMPGGSTHGAGGVIINIRKVRIEMFKNALCNKSSYWLHLNSSLPVSDLCPMHGSHMPVQCVAYLTRPCSSYCLQVRGEVHHDRRLHQLMLQEEVNQVGTTAAAAAAAASSVQPSRVCIGDASC